MAEVNTMNDEIIFISIDMPFFDANMKGECLSETNDALLMIQLLIADHAQHLVVIGGDE